MQPALTIVIPALNEQAAVGLTIERCLAARSRIINNSSVERVEVIVVSDGSTDRTEEIARGYSEVTVLAFDRNRGYGAAIMAGFAHARSDLVGFLDADGTCDPDSFADLCRAIDQQDADVVLGSRLGQGSRMPLIRMIGNRLFAWLLGALSLHKVLDTASGMRVLRRSCLPDIYPPPTGLHFTPAMSAKVLLEGKLRLVEIPIPYAERSGQSKLSVVIDGMRFLRVIVQAAVCYRPARPLFFLATVIALASLALGIRPTIMYLRVLRIEEWMIYRVLLCSLLACLAALTVCTAVVSERVAAVAHGRRSSGGIANRLVGRMLSGWIRWSLIMLLLVTCVGVTWPGMVQLFTTGRVDMHWSRAVLSSLLVYLASVLWATGFMLNMVGLILAQLAGVAAVDSPDRTHEPTPTTA